MKLTEKDFKTEVIHFNFSGMEIDFLRVTNHQELADRFEALSDEEMDQPTKDKLSPYWARVWRGCISLGEYLATENIIKPGMKITELGCGLGLAGVVASKLGAEVTFTDYDPNALIFAKKNWEMNSTHRAYFEVMDWNEPDPKFQADIVLGADVAYGPNFEKLLLNTFDTVCKPGGTIILSDPMRGFSRDFYNNFATSKYETTQTKKQMSFEGISQIQRITLLRNPL